MESGFFSHSPSVAQSWQELSLSAQTVVHTRHVAGHCGRRRAVCHRGLGSAPGPAMAAMMANQTANPSRPAAAHLPIHRTGV